MKILPCVCSKDSLWWVVLPFIKRSKYCSIPAAPRCVSTRVYMCVCVSLFQVSDCSLKCIFNGWVLSWCSVMWAEWTLSAWFTKAAHCLFSLSLSLSAPVCFRFQFQTNFKWNSLSLSRVSSPASLAALLCNIFKWIRSARQQQKNRARVTFLWARQRPHQRSRPLAGVLKKSSWKYSGRVAESLKIY